MSVLVFAYGSNLCLERLGARTPSARPVAIGTLRGHALRWHKRSRDGSGKCDAFASGNPQDLVWGVVYELSASDKPVLDRFEGLGDDYFERELTIELAGDSTHRAFVYLAGPHWIDASVRPYSWYKNFVVTGAAQHGLPEDYRAILEAVEAMDDPDRDRHERETSVFTPQLRRPPGTLR